MYVNGVKLHQFKTKLSEITAYPLCLGNSLKDSPNGNMKETESHGHIYDSTVDLTVLMLTYFEYSQLFNVKKLWNIIFWLIKCFLP